MQKLAIFFLLLSSLHAKSSPPVSPPPPPPSPPPFERGAPFDAGIQPNMRIWGDAEYLYWWTENGPLPVAIATGGSATDGAPAALGQPGTKILFGDETLKNGALSGFRLSLRSWIDAEKNYAIEGSGFWLPEKTSILFSKQGAGVLGVPFNNLAPFPLPADHGGWMLPGPGPTALLLGYSPIGSIGSIEANSSTELWGVELNGLFHFLSRPTFRLSALGGFSFTDLSERLSLFYSSILSTQGEFLAASIEDHFLTENDALVGQFGLRGEWSDGWLFASFIAKVGLGAVLQGVHISGGFVDTTSDLYYYYGAGRSGGIFSQPTNSGEHSQVCFEALPAMTLRFGVNLLRDLRLSFGYDFLFLSNVLRPGDQIDPAINETQAGAASGGDPPVLTGPARPRVLMEQSNYWAQGINAGIEARF